MKDLCPSLNPVRWTGVLSRALARPRQFGAPRDRLQVGPNDQRRQLLTLAIESSCDDTCVAILERGGESLAQSGRSAKLHYNRKITCDNREYRGVHPAVAVVSHTEHLANLVQEALQALPQAGDDAVHGGKPVMSVLGTDGTATLRVKPDFVSVTRGPGMTANLATGLNTAKGLAVAWQVPLLGVNHMQAHALTPRMISALNGSSSSAPVSPSFPFLSLLVSGGHTLLVLSRSLTDHSILAEASNIAIGDLLDKVGRTVVPADVVTASVSPASPAVVYGRLLESFVFPRGEADHVFYDPPRTRAAEQAVFDSGRGWALAPPLYATRDMRFDFSGLNGSALEVVASRDGAMDLDERRLLGRETMRLAFEHLASRLLFVLGEGNVSQWAEEHPEWTAKLKGDEAVRDVKTLVVSGGVASNRFLMHVLRSVLDARGHSDIEIVSPPIQYCTDNAAMIAWTGMEMYEAGYRTDLSVLALRRWPIDPNSVGGGILGADGWIFTKPS